MIRPNDGEVMYQDEIIKALKDFESISLQASYTLMPPEPKYPAFEKNVHGPVLLRTGTDERDYLSIAQKADGSFVATIDPLSASFPPMLSYQKNIQNHCEEATEQLTAALKNQGIAFTVQNQFFANGDKTVRYSVLPEEKAATYTQVKGDTKLVTSKSSYQNRPLIEITLPDTLESAYALQRAYGEIVLAKAKSIVDESIVKAKNLIKEKMPQHSQTAIVKNLDDWMNEKYGRSITG